MHVSRESTDGLIAKLFSKMNEEMGGEGCLL